MTDEANGECDCGLDAEIREFSASIDWPHVARLERDLINHLGPICHGGMHGAIALVLLGLSTMRLHGLEPLAMMMSALACIDKIEAKLAEKKVPDPSGSN